MRDKYAKRDIKLKHNSMNIIAYRVRWRMVLNAAPRLMEEFEQSCTSGFLIASSQTPKVFTLRGVPEDPETHLFGTPRLHEATVPHDFLNLDPPQWGLANGAHRELGPNGCRNLDKDAQRDVKTHFILTQVLIP
jgi:hypothetical protein